MYKEYLIRYSVNRGFTTGIAIVVAQNRDKATKILEAQGKYNGSIYAYRVLSIVLINDTDEYNTEGILEEIATGPGFSAYEIARQHGFKGSEEAWLASLKGEKGDQGPRGETGPQGPQGPVGSSTEGEENLISVTYADLVNLRDRSQLLPGAYYRITDYKTTTTQVDSRVFNLAQFDVVVLALDESTLAEQASAMAHEGNTYFKNQHLEAWDLKYCLDNDTDRFAWADSTNGKGVIYFMKDEYNNECPYDFKSIQFKRYQLTSLEQDYKEVLETIPYIDRAGASSSTMHTKLTIDESKDGVWLSTFSVDYTNILKSTDHSRSGYCRQNIIKPYSKYENNTCKQYLNNIVIMVLPNGTVDCNTFEGCSRDITLISSIGAIERNTFGKHCVGDILINSSTEFLENDFGTAFTRTFIYAGNIHRNFIDSNCKDNFISISGKFSYNSIGVAYDSNYIVSPSFNQNQVDMGFTDNRILAKFTTNTIGAFFRQNIITEKCTEFSINTVGSYFNNNSISGYFNTNTVNSYYSNNTVAEGAEVYRVDIGSSVMNNQFKGIVRSCSIDTSCNYNTFENVEFSRIGPRCGENHFKDVKACTFGCGCRGNKAVANASSTTTQPMECCTFGDYVWFNTFYPRESMDAATPIVGLRVQSGLKGSSASSPNMIEVPNAWYNQEITVAKNSSGVVKAYCAADLIA